MSERICVVIPAYNEAEVIGGVIQNTAAELNKLPVDFKIVVVNDCSTDNTHDVARQAGATVITHIINTGAGGATATGLQYAKEAGFDYCVSMDADGQHCAKDVAQGILEAQQVKADLLIGSRLINKSGMSKTKIIGNQGLSFGTWLLFGVKTSDSQSGLRVFSKTALAKLKWQSISYDFASEQLWRAKQAKLTIAEYPIQAIYTDYSRGKGQSNWNGINIVKSLIKMKIKELIA